MATPDPDPPKIRERRRASEPAPSPPLSEGDDEFIGDKEYEEAFGEDLARTLDVDTWSTGIDWEGAVDRLKVEIKSAVEREEVLRSTVRKELLPLLGTREGAPPEAGVYRTLPSEITKVHEGLLFPGRVEAVDGTSVSHESLPLGITQIGIAVVSYGGTSATFAQRIYRKEIASRGSDAVQMAKDIINKRQTRQAVGQESDTLSELGRRGVMTFAERKILVDKSTAEWRIGHGSPAPYELLTGSGSMRLLEAALAVLERMISEFKKFVFVPSAPAQRGLLTIGNALAAGEYAVIGSIESLIRRVVENGHYGEEYKGKASNFVDRCGPQVMYGLYRTSENAPPYMFYGHREHIHVAARIAIADSILRPARGFPMLIDVADVTCKSAFGAAGFLGLIYDAYAQAGVPMKYFGERDTRR